MENSKTTHRFSDCDAERLKTDTDPDSQTKFLGIPVGSEEVNSKDAPGDRNTNYRRKLLRYIFACAVIFTAGWIVGQRGPVFPYFLKITGTDTGKGSIFITSNSVGFITGSLTGGFIVDKIRLEIIMILACTTMGIVTIVMPWCTIYWTMILVNFLQGIAFGFLLIGGLTECARLWEGNSAARTYLMGMQFFRPFGSMLSPLIVAQFQDDDVSIGDLEGNTTKLPTTLNYTSGTQTGEMSIPFILAGTLSFFVAFPFVIMLCFSSHVRSSAHSPNAAESTKTGHSLSRLLKIVSMCFIGQLMFLANGTENLIYQFLPYFLRTKLNWEKSLSSDIVSLFWGMYSLGRLLGVGVSRFLKSSTQLLLCVILTFASLWLMLLGSYLDINVTFWIATTVLGLSCATTAPCIMSWTFSEIIPASGKLMSFILVTAGMGSMILPIIVGNLMEQYSPVYLIYVSLTTSFLLIVMHICLYYFVRLKLRKLPLEENKQIEVSSDKDDDAENTDVV